MIRYVIGPVRETELSVLVEKGVEMTSVMNLTLDPAKFSRPSRVESAICCIRIITMQIMSSSFYSQIKVLPEKEQKASYSFFLIKSILSQFFDITGHAEQTVIASDDHVA